MPASNQVLQTQMAIFDRSIQEALTISDRKMLLLCRSELGQLLFMRAVRQEKAVHRSDEPIKLMADDGLRLRGVRFSSGSTLLLGMRSAKSLIGLEDLAHVFLEMPDSPSLMMDLMDQAKPLLRPGEGKIVLLASRLLANLKQRPSIPATV